MTSLRNLWGRRTALLGGLLALVAAVAGIGAAGGWGKAPDREPAAVAPGAMIDQGLFHTRAIRAYVGGRADLERESTGRKGARYLSVDFEVTNTGDETVELIDFVGNPFIRQLIFAATPGGKIDPGAHHEWVGPGPRYSQQIPPRSPVPLTVAWYQWTGPDPAQVTVRLAAFERKRPVFFDMPAAWQARLAPNGTANVRDDPAVIAARVTLPVTHRDIP